MEARRLLAAVVVDLGPQFQWVDPASTGWSAAAGADASSCTGTLGAIPFVAAVSGPGLTWGDYGNTRSFAGPGQATDRDGVWRPGDLMIAFSGLSAAGAYSIRLTSVDLGVAGSAASPYAATFAVRVTDVARSDEVVLAAQHTATLYSASSAQLPVVTFSPKSDGTATIVLARTGTTGNVWLNGFTLDDGRAVAADTTAPATAWKTAPYAVKAGGVAAVTMIAQPAADASGVQYYFENAGDPARNSGWTDASSWTDFGVAPGGTFSYHVRVRDRSANLNTSAWSPLAGVTTSTDNAYAGFTSAEVGPAAPQFDFTGMRAIPHAPDAGVHPRIFTSSEELPALRDRLANTASGRASMAQIHAYVQLLLLGNAKYDRAASYAVDALGQALIGNTGFWDSSSQYAALLAYDPTNPTAANPLPFNADGTPDVTRRQIMAAQMACMAYECWVYNGQPEYDARAQDLAKAMANWCTLEANDAALTPTNYNLAGGVQMALAYDFNYNAMTTAQRDVTRQCIVKATWTRGMIYGADTTPQATTSNWAGLNDFVPIEMMAVEGESGYDAAAFRDVMRASYKFETYGWYDTGAPLEGLGKNYQFLATMSAFARRDYQLIGHPHARAFATNYLPQITQPYGYAFQEYDDWGGTGTDSPQTGGYKFQADDAVGAKWLFPNDAGADYVWQNHIGQSATGNPYYYQPIEPRGYENELLVGSLYSSDFGAGDFADRTAAALKGNDTFYDGSRGLFVTRSGFTPDALKLQFHDRQDLGGHTHGDRLDFTLSGLGRLWSAYRTNATGTAYGGGLVSLAETKYANGMLIDGVGQGIDQTANSWAPGKVVSVVDQPNASFVAGDAAYAYQWLVNRQDGVAPGNDDDRIYSGNLKVGESYNTFRQQKNPDPYYDAPLYNRPDWNTPGTYTRFTKKKLLPVVYAFRTAGLVRGQRPYAMVMDDFATGEGADHAFTWQMQLPSDLSIESTTVNADPNDYRKDVVLAEANGNRRLLVRILQADGLVDASSPATLDATLYNPRQDPATAERYNRLLINTRGTSTRIKVLLLPFTVGQPLPTTTVAGNTYTVTMNGSTDTFDFAAGADGRTRYTLRQGAVVAAQNASGDVAPAMPTQLVASAVAHTQIDLSWSANSTNEQLFRIERSTDGVTFSPIVTTLAGVTTYSDTGLTPGVRYTYRVIAANAVASSPSTAAAAVAWPAGEIPITADGQVYGQSFDAMAASIVQNQNWSDDGWLAGWSTRRSDNVSPNTRRDSGTETFPRIFSEGSASDRGFGGMAPGNGYQAQGALFQNLTGATVAGVDLSYAVEQWRRNVNAGAVKLYYKIQASAPTFDLASTAGWTAVSSLDYAAATGAAAALDGNAAANRSIRSATLPLNVSPGQYLWLGWRITGGGNSSNPSLALDNLSVRFAAPAPPSVQSVTVNDGAAQRSMVRSLTLSFDQAVSLAAGAVTLLRRADAAGGASTSVPFSLSAGPASQYVLTFPGTAGGSIADGVYDLSVNGSYVTVASGGLTVAGSGTTAYTFHRLFGDADGNRTVNNGDYLAFKNAFGSQAGSPSFAAAFDYDNNGVINNGDYLAFKNDFGRSVIY